MTQIELSAMEMKYSGIEFPSENPVIPPQTPAFPYYSAQPISECYWIVIVWSIICLSQVNK